MYVIEEALTAHGWTCWTRQCGNADARRQNPSLRSKSARTSGQTIAAFVETTRVAANGKTDKAERGMVTVLVSGASSRRAAGNPEHGILKRSAHCHAVCIVCERSSDEVLMRIAAARVQCADAASFYGSTRRTMSESGEFFSLLEGFLW